jgi:hypothetical protein
MLTCSHRVRDLVVSCWTVWLDMSTITLEYVDNEGVLRRLVRDVRTSEIHGRVELLARHLCVESSLLAQASAKSLITLSPTFCFSIMRNAFLTAGSVRDQKDCRSAKHRFLFCAKQHVHKATTSCTVASIPVLLSLPLGIPRSPPPRRSRGRSFERIIVITDLVVDRCLPLAGGCCSPCSSGARRTATSISL